MFEITSLAGVFPEECNPPNDASSATPDDMEGIEAADHPGSRDPVLIEMHGRLSDVICTAHNCRHREQVLIYPIAPSLAGTEAVVEREGNGYGNQEREIAKEDLPRCSKCGALARPGVVWFGEIPCQIDRIMNLAEKADLCLVIGTSSIVRRKLSANP